MISIFNAIRFISVFSILFEMENDEHGVFVQETGKNNQETGQPNLELNVQSPSETMLERLKEIRKWQEKHREKLAQVQAFNLASPPLASRNTQTAVPTINSDFSSRATKGSVYFHPENNFENKNMCNLALSKFQESEAVSTSGTEHERERGITNLERGGCLKKCNAKPFFSQDAINFCKSTAFIDEALTTWPPHKNTADCVSLTSPESSLNRDTLEECETKSIEEYQEQVVPRSQISNIINVKDIIPASNMNTLMSNNESTKTQIASAHCNNSEQILEERQESAVYHSEKYRSNAEQKFAFLTGISEKTVSKFLSPGRNPVSNIAGEYDDKPKPKHKYLRKGEGTARFGMKSMQLKKSYSSVNSNNSDIINTVKRQELKIISNPESTNVKTSIADNSTWGKNIRKTAKRPINCLQLMRPPDMTTNKFVNEVDSIACTALSDEKWQKFDKEFELVQLCPKTHPNPSVSNVELYNQSLKEKEELSAFEKLEELAADSSFSSNSSTVLQLLQRGLHSMASTPLHSTPPLTYQERLNCNDGEMAPKKCLFEPNTTNLNLLDRLLKSSKDYEEFSSHLLQQKELNISQVLEQLRAIIELEEHDVSEAEIESFFESFGDQHASISHGAASRFACSVSHANTNATSTPALSQDVFIPKPHVHFRNEGVEVLEYELSETDEDTLTDAPTLTEEDSDLATTLDMEALAHLNLHEPLIPHSKMAVTIVNKETEDYSTDESCKSSASSKLLTNDPRQEAGLQPAVLHFSPPQQKQNSASNYIWSIFGKDRYSKKHSDQKVSNNNERVHDSYRNEAVHKQAGKVTAGPKIQEEQHSTTDEIETYKTLLLAKICELEKETKIFKKETSKLQKLQELAVDEKKQLTEERHKLQEETTREKKKFREYIDNERNAVWKEKRGLKHLSPSITMANQNSVEIVYLKEQIQDLQDNGKKRESLHQYTVKKLNEKIKNLEVENNQLKEKVLHFQSLGKENLQLKHELDRIKLTGKRVVVNQVGNAAKENPRPKAKVATVNSVNRSLDKLARIEGKGIGASNEEKCEPSTLSTTHGKGGQDTGNHKTNIVFPSPPVDEQIQINLDEAYQHHKDMRQVNLPTGSLQMAQNTTVPFDDKNSEFTESFRDDGTKEIVYANGNKKEIYLNGLVVVSYYNGDRKEIHQDRTVYIYGTDHTSHTTFNDGKEVLVFPSGQKETRLPDGSSEIIFTDNSRKIISQDGIEMCIMKDGTVVRSNPDGSKVFEFVNGQREIHTLLEKRREYPDGTVKIVHRDGRTETRYKTGRTRIRDSQGNIILDSHHGL